MAARPRSRSDRAQRRSRPALASSANRAAVGSSAGKNASIGIVLVPFAALVAWTGLRLVPPAGAVRAVIGRNAAWVLASLALLIGGWVSPTAIGTAFVIVQAIAVGAFAELQLLGLRRAGAASA